MGNKNSTEGKNSTEDGEDGPKKVGFMKMVRDNYDLLCNGIIRPPRDEYEISGKSTILCTGGYNTWHLYRARTVEHSPVPFNH